MTNSISLAISHIKIEIGNRRVNAETVSRAIRVAKESGAHIVLLPAMFNVGPVLSNEFRVRMSRKSIVEPVPGGPATDILVRAANDFGITIIAGPILERVGARVYKTAMVVEPLRGVVKKIRKIVGDEHVSPSFTELTVDYGVRLGIVLEDDIFLPEISMLNIVQGVDVIIAFLSLDPSSTRQRYALTVRAIECRSMAIGVGGIVTRGGEVLHETPSMIVDEEGSILEEIKGFSERIVVVNIEKKDRNFNDREIKTRLKLVREVVKKLRDLAKD